MRPASLLSRREGCLCPWASVTCLRFFPRLTPLPSGEGFHLQLGEITWATPVFQGVRHPRPVDNLPSPSGVWSSPTKRTGEETWKGEATVRDTHSFIPDNAPTVLGVSLPWLGLFPPGGGRGPGSFSAEKVFTAGQRAQVRQVGALFWAHSRAVCAARTVKAPEPSEDSLCHGTWLHEV